MNHRQLRTRATATPAPMPALAITSGMAKGKTIAPASGVTATNQRRAVRGSGSDGFNSEPLAAGFAGGVAVVFRGVAREVEGDVALLNPIGSSCFNGIGLLTIAEGNLNPERAI